MGSDDKAVITGFICRLCSRMNRFVVHIYGDEGIQMQLAQKINVYLPITVNPSDPLPKTVCISCIESLEAQHELMEQVRWARQRVQRASKGTDEECGRHHSPRPPEGIQPLPFILRPPRPVGASRTSSGNSSNPFAARQSDSISSASSFDHTHDTHVNHRLL